jgi:ketosteroid isomerase-like protein
MTQVRSTEEVFNHHKEAFLTGNIDNIMEDYADDAVLFSPLGVLKGKEGVRVFFTEALKLVPADAAGNIQYSKQIFEGEFGYIVYSSPGVPLGSDTFCIRKGKIVMQSGIIQTNA